MIVLIRRKHRRRYEIKKLTFVGTYRCCDPDLVQCLFGISPADLYDRNLSRYVINKHKFNSNKCSWYDRKKMCSFTSEYKYVQQNEILYDC